MSMNEDLQASVAAAEAHLQALLVKEDPDSNASDSDGGWGPVAQVGPPACLPAVAW